ncbi:hypothetical protein LTR84_012013 [Exophiala bonariae]|uniref:Uncharacterized protein n=1 Tax=Exophiala bonariae TaxID=1690606 RepID=A0AAV9MRT6_9EURO|nr:hypothetical protein LTR84_012013 [Exophiala bonariae]
MAQPAPSDDPYGSKIVTEFHHDTYPFINPEKGAASDIKVLVTGASRGIGYETVKSFARAGASAIALLARSQLDDVAKDAIEVAKAAGHKQPKILKLQTDMSDPAAVGRAMDIVAEHFQSLDVVINNASRLEKWVPLAQTDVDDWWLTWEVNLKGTFIVTRAALPLHSFQRANSPGASAYQMSKTTQIRLNDFLMAEYGDMGLIAYAVHPGGVKTETALNMPEYMHSYLTQTPQLCADTIVWLTRERKEWLAGRFVFGPLDMQELAAKESEILKKDSLKLKLVI